MTVGRRTVSLSVPVNDENFMRRLEDGEIVPWETPLIGTGRRLAYLSANGGEGEATMDRVSV